MLAILKKYRAVVSIIVAFIIGCTVFSLAPFATNDANKAVGISLFLICLWISESFPMPVVALLPIVLFPLARLGKIEEIAQQYGNPVIFLFLGGFLLGLAIEKWNLHKRIALTIVKATGSSGNKILLGFTIATCFLSMWLSNTATTMMLFPIAVSVIKVIDESNVTGNKQNFALSIMLIIAYASNFGGMATVIGTPPNVAFLQYLGDNAMTKPSFFQWMLLCTPVAIALCGILFLLLTRILFPNHIADSYATNNFVKQELAALGAFSKAEKRVTTVFALTAFLWIFKDLIVSSFKIKLDDNMIAIFGAVLLFIVNAGTEDEKGNSLQLLEWEDTSKMAWGILFLFGGGIAIANVLQHHKVMDAIGLGLKSFGLTNILLLILLTSTISIFLSEVMSNVAQVIVFAPIVCSFAVALNINPVLLGLPMTLAASAAGMLPMGTPPNAIVFSSKKVKLKQMLLVGFIMNIVSIIIITLVIYFFGQKVFS